MLELILWFVWVPAAIVTILLCAKLVGQRLRRNHGPLLRRDGPQPYIERT